MDEMTPQPMLGSNWLIGRVQLRQARVALQPCIVSPVHVERT
jgi:hypothetical protein